MRSRRNVTRAPTGMPFRNLKFDTSLVEYVVTAFCPVIWASSSRAPSMILRSAMALPRPWLRQIFSILGTCMELLYSKRSWSFGTTSSSYCFLSRGT